MKKKNEGGLPLKPVENSTFFLNVEWVKILEENVSENLVTVLRKGLSNG